jgi:hypothetical protein
MVILMLASKIRYGHSDGSKRIFMRLEATQVESQSMDKVLVVIPWNYIWSLMKAGSSSRVLSPKVFTGLRYRRLKNRR